MIKHTFLHIPGIGKLTEQRFWEAGIHSWDDFSADGPLHLSPQKRARIADCLDESRLQIDCCNPNYFSDLLATNQHWRLFPEFRHSLVYLDIETTGLEVWGSEITTIALCNGVSVFYYVAGQNLEEFLDEIAKYKVIVTYNGKTFDIPFIERSFGINLPQAHIDLRYILASLGYKGGLKRCEAQFGIGRGELQEVDGFFAVLLWQDYVTNGNPKALETLLAYNIKDAVNLETLMVAAYNLKIEQTPFYRNQIPEPLLPEIPFTADIDTIARIKRNMGPGWYGLWS